jgi:hypothetical protein
VTGQSWFLEALLVRQADGELKNPLAFFNILKEPLLVQKQTILQQKALDLSFIWQPKSGRGIIKRAPRLLAANSIFCWILWARRVFDFLPSMTSQCLKWTSSLIEMLRQKWYNIKSGFPQTGKESPNDFKIGWHPSQILPF